ncbi:MAG: EAL domain-containing protein [Blautia sp.]|nr:EAL domain-containing protein [Blautia sp.]
MGNESKIKSFKLFGTVFLVLAAILLVVLMCSYRVVGELEEQLNQNLEDVANQNVMALRNQVHANYLLVKTLAAELEEMQENREEAVADFDVFVEEYGLKRIAFCTADGMTHSTDGVTTDLSYREFYQRGMQGLGTVTEILEDAMDEEHGLINIMSVPMYDAAGNIDGVFGMTYDSESFNDSLRIDSFEGQGYSCAVNEEGQIMVSTENGLLALSSNIFADVLEKDDKNAGSVEEMQASMQKGQSCSGTLYLSQESYYYCTPVELMDGDVNWYVFTIVPAAYLQSRLTPVLGHLYLMGAGVAFCILCGVALMILFSRKQREQMRRLAYVDPLTGGANFAKFCGELNGRRSRQGYLIAMDIMNFNNINVAAGKETGDAILKETWRILHDTAGSEELFCRVEGDEFALFLTAISDTLLVERMEKLSEQMNQLAATVQVWGVRARYGIYRMDGTKSAESSFERAQVAREVAKKSNKEHYAFYDEADQQKRRMDRQIEDNFEEALSSHAFEVWFQPKYSTDTGQIVGSEALVRWRKEDGSMIPPGRFIPLLEENGMIVRLDEYMFREVCRQQKAWLDSGKQIYPVSVNLSRASLFYADIVEKYKEILAGYGLDTSYVQIEVTESAVEGKAKLSELLERFREIGIRILMDDFGTGYSSLSTLNMKCFDTLKLDKSLIDHIGEKDGETLLSHVIHMGQQLGMHITAEGVESSSQLVYLQKMKCDDIQGFLFAKPMHASEFEPLMREGKEK